MRQVLGLSLLVMWVGSAHAQPVAPAPEEPPPPAVDPPPADPPPPPPSVSSPPAVTPSVEASPPPPYVAAPTGYPLQLAARPLILPVGGVEAGAELQWSRAGVSPSSTSYIAAEPRVRYSAPGVELEARVGVALYQTDPDLPGVTVEIERLASVAGMVRARLDDDTAIGAEVVARTPAADFSTYLARAFVVTKRHLSPRAAVELEGFAGVSRAPVYMGKTENHGTGGGELRAVAQVSDAFAVIGRANLSLQSLPYTPDNRWFVVGTYGVRGVIAANANIDLVAGLDAIQSHDVPVVQMTVGFVARRVP